MSLVQFPQAARGPTAVVAGLPRTPQSIDETGLPLTFLVELVAKSMFQLGLTRLTDLSQHLCLAATVTETICQFMRRESLLEIMRRGQNDSDVQYELTLAGRARAGEWLVRNSYAGAAPVPLAHYAQQVAEQSVTKQHIAARHVRAAFADLVLPPVLVDQLGTAVNSGRPVLLFGPAGSGKTFVAERLQRLLGSAVAIPHAIYVQGEVIRVFDAQCHRAVAAPTAHGTLDTRVRPDSRWMLCERPVVISGGELTLEMLDLSFDARSGFYEAPPHFKANNGLFIVDDLGRQIVSPRALMNRWIVPMERRHDHLMLRNGGKFTIPFDMVLVFSTNLEPAQLDDAAFLRRLGHKIAVDAVSPDEYRRIFEGACAAEGIAFDATVFAMLVNRYHGGSGRPLLACYPRDLLHLIRSHADYLEQAPALSPEFFDWAWNTYFAADRAAGAISSMQ